jgi:hypothetical protein
MNRPPRFGEANLGAVAGVVTGAVGGLLAVGIPLAISGRDPGLLVIYRSIGLFGFLLCTPLGWILGGQIGPRLTGTFGEQRGEIIGGILGGLVPVMAIIYWVWSKAHG